MIIAFSLSRRKLIVAGVMALALIWLLKHAISPVARIVGDTAGIDCPSLRQGRHDWSTKFHKVHWTDFFRKDGRDVAENVRKLRNFERCFLGANDTGSDRVSEIQQQLFPYLNFEGLARDRRGFWPRYTRWDGDVLEGSVPRFSAKENTFQHAVQVEYDGDRFFWDNWLQHYVQPGSKGIVISAGDYQCADAMRLLRILRHIKNSLPIQIVHKGDLATQYQEYLVAAARNDDSDAHPAQELWFVDVSGVLAPQYTERFTRFSNKWLALLFCSFENAVMMDADTIPFVPLEQYYQWEQFAKAGAVFFKDRKLTSDLFRGRQLKALKDIADSVLGLRLRNARSSDEVRHQLSLAVQDLVALETIEAMFTQGRKHHMESGLMVIDKRRHLMSLLTSLSLQFSTIQEYFHGDKEWFWIAQFLRNEFFTFHPVDASNVGKLGHVISDDSKEFFQICSVQLSHTDTDGSILWINGGLSTCKKNSWDYDYKSSESVASLYSSVDELREHYLSPVELEGAIIPDVAQKPWVKTSECAAFSYCTLYKEGEFGKVIKFNESAKQIYREIVRIWNLPI